MRYDVDCIDLIISDLEAEAANPRSPLSPSRDSGDSTFRMISTAAFVRSYNIDRESGAEVMEAVCDHPGLRPLKYRPVEGWVNDAWNRAADRAVALADELEIEVDSDPALLEFGLSVHPTTLDGRKLLDLRYLAEYAITDKYRGTLSDDHFDRGNAITKLDTSGYLEEVKDIAVVSTIDRRAAIVDVNKDGECTIGKVRPDLAKRMVAEGAHGLLPVVKSVSRCPVVHADGRVTFEEGLDVDTGILITKHHDLDLDSMTPQEAWEKLQDLVAEFPFDNDTSKSAWIATLLAVVGRNAINGMVPMTLVDANSPGCGKSLLMDLIGLIAFGHSIEMKSDIKGNDELRKKITTSLISGEQMFVIDNIASGSSFGLETLCTALTARRWSDRELGSNAQVKLDNNLVFVGTGNNIQAKADMNRRVLWCVLKTQVEDPYKVEHSIKNIESHVRERRDEYLSAALILLAEHLKSGKPGPSKRPGSFYAWSDVVRGSIINAGGTDPYSFEVVEQRNEGKMELLEFLQEFPAGEYSVSDLNEGYRLTTGQKSFITGRAGNQSVSDRLFAQGLGQYLDQPCNGYRLHKRQNAKGRKVYRVEEQVDGQWVPVERPDREADIAEAMEGFEVDTSALVADQVE